MKEQILLMFLQVQLQFRILHWQTTSEARHLAYGKIYGDLDDKIDEFVEICQGKHGRFELNEQGADIKIFNLKSLEINSFLNSFIEFLIGLSKEYSPEQDSDLLNLRDEMLADINKLKYLLTLK